MICLNNPLLLPFLMLIWSLDMWLWLTALRFLLEHLPFPKAKALSKPLQQLTDPIPLWINHLSLKLFKKHLSWRVIWFITIVLALLLRHLLLCFVISIQPIQ